MGDTTAQVAVRTWFDFAQTFRLLRCRGRQIKLGMLSCSILGRYRKRSLRPGETGSAEGHSTDVWSNVAGFVVCANRPENQTC
jgi:hypothetical protein